MANINKNKKRFFLLILYGGDLQEFILGNESAVNLGNKTKKNPWGIMICPVLNKNLETLIIKTLTVPALCKTS